MPYITKSEREELTEYCRPQATSGELSYALSEVIRSYMFNKPNGGWRAMSEVYGALAGARLAFEQEVVIPYEAKKRLENGPIYDKET